MIYGVSGCVSFPLQNLLMNIIYFLHKTSKNISLLITGRVNLKKLTLKFARGIILKIEVKFESNDWLKSSDLRKMKYFIAIRIELI